MQTRLFVRKDIYGKYVSCLVYLSRDRYNTKVRLAVQDILRRKFNGSQLDFSAVVGETPIARLHIVVRADPGQKLADPNVPKLEQAVAAAVRSWDDDLIKEAVSQLGEGPGRTLLAEFTGSIPETYKADVPAVAAVADLAKILQMRDRQQDIAFEMWESAGFVGGLPVEYESVEGADPGPSAGPGRREAPGLAAVDLPQRGADHAHRRAAAAAAHGGRGRRRASLSVHDRRAVLDL